MHSIKTKNMISRRYLRTKVMQAIFAHEMNAAETLPAGEKKLTKSIESCYTLFLYFFSIFPELKDYRTQKMEDVKQKFSPSFQDLNPNTKFVDNAVIKQIEENVFLKIKWNEQNINWADGKELIIKLYKTITELPDYEQYMLNPERSYAEDKKLLLTIIEKVLLPDELLHWHFEEQNVHWFDDYNDALLLCYQNIAKFKESAGDQCKIFGLYKDAKEETDFYTQLFSKTILNDKVYNELIESKLQNWESERLIGLDIILMKMALCEFMEFPTIPIKVTINEYIELAKTYSSAKSGHFINGLLDKILADLRSEGKLHKMGRGLLNNSTL